MHPYLSLGRLHLPVFGIFAAAGLMAAMLLSQRTARLAKIDAAALWDLGMVTVFSAFVLSRLLLVAENFRTFISYPVLVLALPSLTSVGIALTVVVSLGYLQHRALPPLAVLDAAAPCIAMAWAFLNLGLIAEGTRDGMPTTVPWAIGSGMGRVHPVELYTVFAALALCGVLLWMLPHRIHVGEIGARGLVLGGLLAVALDSFRLPAELYEDIWLDRVQWVGLAMIVAGFGVTVWRWLPAEHRRAGVDAV